MGFTMPKFEKLSAHAEEIKEACEAVTEARDAYDDAEDVEDRDAARSDARDAVEDIERLVHDDDYRKLRAELDEAVGF